MTFFDKSQPRDLLSDKSQPRDRTQQDFNAFHGAVRGPEGSRARPRDRRLSSNVLRRPGHGRVPHTVPRNAMQLTEQGRVCTRIGTRPGRSVPGEENISRLKPQVPAPDNGAALGRESLESRAERGTGRDTT